MKISIVVRDFNPGAGREIDGSTKTIDMDAFRKKSQATMAMLSSPLVEKVVVVSNRDAASKFGEKPNVAGDTPTWCTYHEIYPELVKHGNIVPVFVDNWGNNAGSGRAVQAGVDYLLKKTNVPYIMAWSPELKITQTMLAQAMGFVDYFNLDGIGFLREHYANKPQWMLPQHTGLIASRECWELATIPTYADGDEGLTVSTTVGLANLAGMDDMARLLLAWELQPKLSLGMYGWKDPIPWTIDLDDPRQQEKIARQWAVVLEWARRTFPEDKPEAVLNRFLANLKML